MADGQGIVVSLTVSATLLLGGCVSATQYSATAEALKGSPALQSEGVDRCVRDNRSTAEQKDLLLKLMNLAPGSDVVRASCERMIRAVASGRLSHQDFQGLTMGQVTPQFIRVLQDR